MAGTHNGYGIDDALKKTLFDPKRRYGGIGVHQAKEIVMKYSGRISVYDRIPGMHSEGTEFVVWLPSVKIKNKDGIEK